MQSSTISTLAPPKAHNPDPLNKLDAKMLSVVIGQIMKGKPDKYPCPPEMKTITTKSITDKRVHEILEATKSEKQKREEKNRNKPQRDKQSKGSKGKGKQQQQQVRVKTTVYHQVSHEEEDDLMAEYYGTLDFFSFEFNIFRWRARLQLFTRRSR